MDLATAYVQIVPTTKGIKGELESVLGNDAESAGKSAGSKFSSALGGTLKTGIAATAALGTAVIGAGAALTSAAGSVASYGDNIDKMSQKMGLSATAYQEWDAVMQHSGTSMETMKASMKTLANAATTNSAAFKELGITEKDLANMSQEELFEATIAGLQNVEDTTQRTYLAGKLLGRGATELGALLNTSAEETQAMRDRVHELGGVMSDEAVKNSAAFQDSLQDLQTSFAGVKNSVMADMLPAFTSVMDGLTSLVAGEEGAQEKIAAGIQGIIDNISSGMPRLIEGFSSIAGAFLEVAPDLIKTLGDGILQAIPTLIPTLIEVVGEIGKNLIDMLPQLIKVGLEVILELAKGIADALPKLIPTIVDVVLDIVDTLIDNVDLLIDGAIALIMGLATGLIDALPRLIERIPEIVVKIVKALIENAPKLLEAGIQLVVTLAKGLIEAIPKLIAAVPQIIKGIWDTIKNTDWLSLGKNIISGIVEGIKSMASAVWNAIKQICKDALKSVKSFFGISSPSKVMRDQVGKWIPEGMAVGIAENMDVVADAMQDLSDEATANINGSVQSVVAVQSANTSNLNRSSTNGTVATDTNGINAIIEALSHVTVTMDGKAVGNLVASPVNYALGRLSVRRV